MTKVTHGLLRRHHWKGQCLRDDSLLMVHPLTARSMPDLGVSTMNDAARRFFLDIIQFERISTDRSLSDVLELAGARGFAVHPSDWVPHPDDYPAYPPLYRPWAIWLAENGFTPFTAGVPITKDNFHRYSKGARRHAFRRLYESDRPAAYEFLMEIRSKTSAVTLIQLLNELEGRGTYNCNSPSDMTILQYFLTDRSEKLRQYCRERIQLMFGFETVEAHAKYIVRHFEIQRNRIVPSSPEPLIFPVSHSPYQSFEHTTIEALAHEFSLSPLQTLNMWDDKETIKKLEQLVLRVGSVEVRSALAERYLEQGKQCVPHLLRGCDNSLWTRAIGLELRSEYMWSVANYVGYGAIDVSTMHQLLAYERLERTIKEELESGKSPNESHDPVRVLGLLLDKNAASIALRDAISFGMAVDNPRLSMLKLNLQL